MRPQYVALALMLGVPALRSGLAAQEGHGAELGQVLQHIENEEPLEVANEQRWELRLRGSDVADIDGNGVVEVFLWTEPHFRQSPPIVIYSVTDAGEVVRITEGLAPGPLAPVSHSQIDLHTKGLAADFSTDGPEPAPANVVPVALAQGMHLVRYSDFFHVDYRGSASGYVDVAGRTYPGADRTCESFEFATVRGIAAGLVPGSGTYLVAVAADSLYAYRIEEIPGNGILAKSVFAQPIPDDFASLPPAGGDIVRYRTKAGSLAPLRISP